MRFDMELSGRLNCQSRKKKSQPTVDGLFHLSASHDDNRECGLDRPYSRPLRGSSHIQPKTSVKDSCCSGQGHVARELILPGITLLADYHALSCALNGSVPHKGLVHAGGLRSNCILRSLIVFDTGSGDDESAQVLA
jgi:hypothetical protein